MSNQNQSLNAWERNNTNTLRFAIERLLEAHQAALAMGKSPESYACQLPHLQDQGVSETVLRWLISNGFAEHLLENTKKTQFGRTFSPGLNLRFTSSSCFIITTAGIDSATNGRTLFDPETCPSGQSHGCSPKYDSAIRTLFLNQHIVKEFKQPAANQELILQAFEEENWPLCLLDPLPGKKDINTKKRLNDTIRNLNVKQRQRLMRFHGDGTGTAIQWEMLR